MWHKQSFTQFWSQSDAYSRRSSLKLTYIHHPLVVCTHQICCAVAVPIALSQDRLLHGHNRLVNWTPCSRMRESKLKRPIARLWARATCRHLWFHKYELCSTSQRPLTDRAMTKSACTSHNVLWNDNIFSACCDVPSIACNKGGLACQRDTRIS